jgi:hypothetical protein
VSAGKFDTQSEPPSKNEQTFCYFLRNPQVPQRVDSSQRCSMQVNLRSEPVSGVKIRGDLGAGYSGNRPKAAIQFKVKQDYSASDH